MQLQDPPVQPLTVAVDKGINELGASYQYEHEELTSNPHHRNTRIYSGARYLEEGLNKNRTYKLRQATSLLTRHGKACSVAAITLGGYDSPLGSAKYPEPRIPHKFALDPMKPESTMLLTLDKIRKGAQPGEIIDGGEKQASQITILAGRRAPVPGQSREAVVMAAMDASSLRPHEDFQSTSGLYAAGHKRYTKIQEMAAAEKRREETTKLRAIGSMGVYSNLLSGIK